MVTKHKRTAAEQKFWDEIAKSIGPDCLKGATNEPIDGCAKLARDFADAMLSQRRESQALDRIVDGRQS